MTRGPISDGTTSSTSPFDSQYESGQPPYSRFSTATRHRAEARLEKSCVGGTYFQSSRNIFNPASVMEWLYSDSSRSNGMVQTSAPAFRHSRTSRPVRMLAARILVL